MTQHLIYNEDIKSKDLYSILDKMSEISPNREPKHLFFFFLKIFSGLLLLFLGSSVYRPQDFCQEVFVWSATFPVTYLPIILDEESKKISRLAFSTSSLIIS